LDPTSNVQRPPARQLRRQFPIKYWLSSLKHLLHHVFNYGCGTAQYISKFLSDVARNRKVIHRGQCCVNRAKTKLRIEQRNSHYRRIRTAPAAVGLSPVRVQEHKIRFLTRVALSQLRSPIDRIGTDWVRIYIITNEVFCGTYYWELRAFCKRLIRPQSLPTRVLPGEAHRTTQTQMNCGTGTQDLVLVPTEQFVIPVADC
jgi:hypothetical protein